MAERIITWHIPNPGVPLERYYMERDYIPERLRILAEQAPMGADCEVDIRDDGTTIFNNRALRPTSRDASRDIGATPKTTAVLPKGETLEEYAEDFITTTIAEGSVLTCHEIEMGGAANVTVQLELESLAEEEEDSD